MSSVWGEDDKDGDLNGDTNGAEIRLSNDVVVVEDMEVVG
jgi:hypothetical protein